MVGRRDVATQPSAKLAAYRAKRDFAVTAEPAGGAAGDERRRFVVQRHRARRLHYDFRLELDGVLVSWAVPKGPTLDPKARHLAVHVEDHPIEYFDFEGVIPKGQYGGGDVIVWDWGTWAAVPNAEPSRAIADGELHFELQGAKLAGRFLLVRRDRGPDDGSGKLLFHKNDDDARPGWDPEAHPRSVKTGRTNEEVASTPDVLWRSDLPAAEAAVSLSAALPSRAGPTGEELHALDEIGRQGLWAVQGEEVKLTNLDKVLFPARDEAGPLTKRDVVRYFAVIAPFMLPYLFDRPVNLNRFPNGVDRPGFWHKEVPSHAPAWLRRWRNDEADPGETEHYAVLDSVPALVWMANYGALELHGWTSRLPDVHEPTWALIDIDPGPASTFDDVVVLARLYRAALEHLAVTAMPKVTGKRGIQIWVPIAPGHTFTDTRAWVETVSRAVGHTVPELVSWEWQKDRRGGLARLDYTQNATIKTLVAPYAVRPAAGAPVSAPISWEELDDSDLRSDRWTIRSVQPRLDAVGDPLAPLIGRSQRLPTL